MHNDDGRCVGYISKFSSSNATSLWCRLNDMSSTDPDYENILSHPGEFEYVYATAPLALRGPVICAYARLYLTFYISHYT